MNRPVGDRVVPIPDWEVISNTGVGDYLPDINCWRRNV